MPMLTLLAFGLMLGMVMPPSWVARVNGEAAAARYAARRKGFFRYFWRGGLIIFIASFVAAAVYLGPDAGDKLERVPLLPVAVFGGWTAGVFGMWRARTSAATAAAVPVATTPSLAVVPDTTEVEALRARLAALEEEKKKRDELEALRARVAELERGQGR